MSELGNTFLKKLDKKNKNKVKLKMPHVDKKPIARNANLLNQKTKTRMDYEWIDSNTLRKSNPKNKKKPEKSK